MAVATCEPLGPRLAGPAIRAWQMALALAAEQDVQLVTIEACHLDDPRLRARSVGPEELAEVEQWCDVLVFQGGLLRIHPFLRQTQKVVVADVYDPFHLENFEQTRGQPPGRRREVISHLVSVINEQLERGDFFLCASERQRDFWIGHLAALGRVNPTTYDEDETLRSLISVVPFGLPDEPPAPPAGPVVKGVEPGIAASDRLILWGGGVYNWFDPLTLVHAVDRLRHRLPDVRLYFMGLRHPNPNIPEMRTAVALRELAEDLKLVGTHVFFNEGWVPYAERAGFLLEADVGVSTHLNHVETAYSFRTRMLDYLWAALPMVATKGDVFAELIEAEGLGLTVPAGDADALEGALHRILTDDGLAARCRANAVRLAPRYSWSRVLAPLLQFCRSPRRAPDLVS